MKGKELAELAMKYEDFDFEFRFTEEPQAGDRFLNVRSFEKLELCDVGHSSKVVILSGEEC
jgi:hypothetical protein